MIWSLDDYLADDILLNEDLNDMLNLKLGHLYENIEISEGAISFELDKFLLKGKPDKRLIFIGDSVRMMHPMAGQAWNQALRDISYIADALFESKNLGIELISTPSFNAFTRIRKLEGEGMTNSIDFINYIYTLDSSISKGFRRNMMKLINTIKPVNKLFITEYSKETGCCLPVDGSVLNAMVSTEILSENSRMITLFRLWRRPNSLRRAFEPVFFKRLFC